jgi:hypothetical protein
MVRVWIYNSLTHSGCCSCTAWPGNFLSVAVTAQSSDFGFGGSRQGTRLMGADSFPRNLITGRSGAPSAVDVAFPCHIADPLI